MGKRCNVVKAWSRAFTCIQCRHEQSLAALPPLHPTKVGAQPVVEVINIVKEVKWWLFTTKREEWTWQSLSVLRLYPDIRPQRPSKARKPSQDISSQDSNRMYHKFDTHTHTYRWDNLLLYFLLHTKVCRIISAVLMFYKIDTCWLIYPLLLFVSTSSTDWHNQMLPPQ
jgi:hypothetical protein